MTKVPRSTARPKDPQFRAGWECPQCGLERQEDAGPDPCMGILPGVLFACCGHGKGGGRGYIMFENGVTVRFDIDWSKPPQSGSDAELQDSIDLHDHMHGYRKSTNT